MIKAEREVCNVAGGSRRGGVHLRRILAVILFLDPERCSPVMDGLL